MRILINQKTEAVTTEGFVPRESERQLAIFASGLSNDEFVYLQFSIDGTTWTDLYQYGVRVKLSSSNTAIGLYLPARLRLIKGVTINPVTVGISSKVGHQE